MVWYHTIPVWYHVHVHNPLLLPHMYGMVPYHTNHTVCVWYGTIPYHTIQTYIHTNIRIFVCTIEKVSFLCYVPEPKIVLGANVSYFSRTCTFRALEMKKMINR